MKFSSTTKVNDLSEGTGFVARIHNNDEYEQALELMDDLIEEYDRNLPRIEVLASSIEEWENEAEDLAEFNKRVEKLDDGVAVLQTLMDQYQLKADDLKSEIGSESLVSMILNGSKKLTRDHVRALSGRFNIPPSVFGTVGLS